VERVRWRDADESRRAALLRRPALKGAASREAVRAIVESVRTGGDAALRELTRRLDGADLPGFEVSAREREAAFDAVSPARREAMRAAVVHLERFHAKQGLRESDVETLPGVRCGRVVRPVARIGLYAPGGTAPLSSTVLMLGVPARLAGCPLRILCSPPRRDGSIDPHILLAAALAGVERIFKAGGAQAVAAMAYGTETVPKVDKIFGPGNAWVTAAKTLVAEDPDGAAIDMPAGPSEVLVVADADADPALVASDLLSQAEHGPDSQVVLVATASSFVDAVERELSRQLESLPRAAIVRGSLAHAVLVEVSDAREAMEVSNRYAPEHLILQTRDAGNLVRQVTNAGSVFVGPWSPESAGDYASGTNHVLPTYGHARALSGLSVEAFQKTVTVQELTGDGLARLTPVVEALAEMEGLEAHRRAVSLRRERLPAASAVEEGTPARLARATVRTLEPYRSARSIASGAPILLDANESAQSPLPGRPRLNRYPPPQPQDLMARLATLYGTDPAHLVVGRGTDDLIDWLVRAFCEAREDAIVVCPPTYGVYSIAAGIQGAAVREVPLGPPPRFRVDVASVLAAVGPSEKLVFVCSPNNPTGGLVDDAAIRALAEGLDGRALLVLDEAYVEFSSSRGWAPQAGRIASLVVLRTLSKAFGLAGARCGAGIMHPEVADLIHRVRAPYPLSAPSIETAMSVLDDAGIGAARARAVSTVQERERLAAGLRGLGGVREVYPSDANFLLVRFDDAGAVVRACRAAGIVVRDRSGERGLAGCVRITVGTPAENDSLLRVLAGTRE